MTEERWIHTRRLRGSGKEGEVREKERQKNVWREEKKGCEASRKVTRVLFKSEGETRKNPERDKNEALASCRATVQAHSLE